MRRGVHSLGALTREPTVTALREGFKHSDRDTLGQPAACRRRSGLRRAARVSAGLAFGCVLLFAGVAGAKTGVFASCGHVSGGTSNDAFTFYSYRVYASNVACSRAKAVAHAWGRATSFDGPAPLNAIAAGFRCRRHDYSDEPRCLRGAAVVAVRRAPPVPAIVDNTGYVNFALMPATISQGASNQLYLLHWRSWGGSSANASGYLSEGGTAGYPQSHAVLLEASTLATCQGIRVYTLLRITEVQTNVTNTEHLVCSRGEYY